MKILQVASGDFFSTYGGGQVYVKNIADRMIDMGLDISIISFVGSDNVQKNIYRNHRIVSAPSGISESDLESIIRDIDPDIIHANSNEAIICQIGKKLNIPVIVTSHHGGLLCPGGAFMNCNDNICQKKVNHEDCLPCVLRNTIGGFKLCYPLMKHLSPAKYIALGHYLESLNFIPFITPIGKAALHIERMKKNWNEVIISSTLIIAPSERIAEAMITNGLDERKIRILPHGIPLPSSKTPQPNIADGKIKFFYVGRICYIKGLHILLEAFRNICAPEIELHLIGGTGNKEEEQYLSRLRKKYAYDNRIFWHGKLDPSKIYDLTQQFHISVAPTICMEIFGLNIAEALALGKPVLATRCGGAEMQIKDGINGWLIPPNDVNALSNKLQEIINEPRQIEKMSVNCSAISIEEHCNELLKIYNSVIQP